MRKKTTLLYMVFFVALMMVGIPVSSAAPINEKGELTPFYTYISATSVSLSIENNGLAYSGGTIKIFKDYDTSITLTLQRRTDSNQQWTDVKSWSKSFSGIGSHSFQKEYYVSTGYIYRVVHTTKVLNDNQILEEIESYSKEKKY